MSVSLVCNGLSQVNSDLVSLSEKRPPCCQKSPKFRELREAVCKAATILDETYEYLYQQSSLSPREIVWIESPLLLVESKIKKLKEYEKNLLPCCFSCQICGKMESFKNIGALIRGQKGVYQIFGQKFILEDKRDLGSKQPETSSFQLPSILKIPQKMLKQYLETLVRSHVIVHEYGHALAAALLGIPSTCFIFVKNEGITNGECSYHGPRKMVPSEQMNFVNAAGPIFNMLSTSALPLLIKALNMPKFLMLSVGFSELYSFYTELKYALNSQFKYKFGDFHAITTSKRPNDIYLAWACLLLAALPGMGTTTFETIEYLQQLFYHPSS